MLMYILFLFLLLSTPEASPLERRRVDVQMVLYRVVHKVAVGIIDFRTIDSLTRIGELKFVRVLKSLVYRE